MAEEASAPAVAVVGGGESGGGGEKMTMVVGVDDSETSYYALQWVLQHFFPPATAGHPPPPKQQQYRLVVVTAKPASMPAVGPAGPGGAPVLFVDSDLPNKASQRVIDKAKELCAQQQVAVGDDAEFEAVEGDARTVLCDAVDRHHAEMLVVGSHGYGAIKRAVLGERQRLLRPSHTLHRHDCQEAKAQALIDIVVQHSAKYR